jgi:uncharacterized protein YozE (UPF0346 family)
MLIAPKCFDSSYKLEPATYLEKSFPERGEDYENVLCYLC